MKYLKRKPVCICYFTAAILGIFAAIRIPALQLTYRFANGLFFGGALLFLWGLIRLARHMGVGDAFLYSRLRFRQLLGKKKEKTAEIKSYGEYLMEKPESKPYGILILSGFLLVVFSVIISVFF